MHELIGPYKLSLTLAMIYAIAKEMCDNDNGFAFMYMSVGIVVKEGGDGVDKVIKHLRMTESKKLQYQTTDK